MTTGGSDLRDRFRDALVLELESRAHEHYDTLYLGGGTPSLLRPEALGAILAAVSLADDGRVYLEANPEDASRENLAAWRELGVHTLSLGLQSLDDDALVFLGRRHSGAEGARAVENARKTGFETVSVDLIFGLPEQSESAWREELERAASLEPDHVSCYQLTVEDGTPFAGRRSSGKLVEATEERKAALYLLTHEVLTERGYEGYEVSNFARAHEHRSRHNEKYWSHAPYLGVGPSAHSFDGHTRSWNVRSLSPWSSAVAERGEATEGRERLSDDQLLLETVMLRLRTTDGLDLRAVQERFGVDLLEANAALFERLERDGRIELEDERVRPTPAGLAVADAMARELRLPEALGP